MNNSDKTFITIPNLNQLAKLEDTISNTLKQLTQKKFQVLI